MLSSIDNSKIENLARFGFITRGIVYGTIGLLAAKLAIGEGGKTTDTHGAIQTLGSQPFGKFLLIILAIGFAGYALWKFVRAFAAIKKEDKKEKLKSVMYASIGFINAGLSYSAIRLFNNSAIKVDATKTWTAKLMSQPFGIWLVGLVGLSVIAGGFYQFYKVYKKKFNKDLKLEEMGPKEREINDKAATIGISSRGVVFCLIGYFLVQSAIKENPHEARGLSGALHALIEQQYGPVLLGVVAIGFMLYAVYSFINAKYNKIKTY